MSFINLAQLLFFVVSENWYIAIYLLSLRDTRKSNGRAAGVALILICCALSLDGAIGIIGERY